MALAAMSASTAATNLMTMMTDPTHPDTWQEHNDRPAWVRRHRDELMDATGLEIPQSLAALPDWLDDYKSTMTRKLREHHSEKNSESTDDGGDD